MCFGAMQFVLLLPTEIEYVMDGMDQDMVSISTAPNTVGLSPCASQ